MLGGELVRLTIDELAAGRAVETPQPEDGVTYAEKISKAEALIDWREDAEQVLRKVQSLHPRSGRRDPVERRAAENLGRPERRGPRAGRRRRGDLAAPGTVIAASAGRHRGGLRARCPRGSSACSSRAANP